MNTLVVAVVCIAAAAAAIVCVGTGLVLWSQSRFARVSLSRTRRYPSWLIQDTNPEDLLARDSPPLLSSDKETLRFEYDQTQQMLRHFDTTAWQITSVIFAANAGAFGLVATQTSLSAWVALTVALASCTSIVVWAIEYVQRNALMNWRAVRLWQIESDLQMLQHRVHQIGRQRLFGKWALSYFRVVILWGAISTLWLVLISYRFLAPAAAQTAPEVAAAAPVNEQGAIALYTMYIALAALIVAVITFVAVCVQIWLARRTLDLTNDELELTDQALKAAKDELELAKEQLRETKNAADQTRLALQYTKEQIDIARRDAVNRIKQSAPYVIADVRLDQDGQTDVVWITNKGGVALYVGLSGISPDSKTSYRADNSFELIGPNEERPTKMRWLRTGLAQFAQFVRLRYRDTFGNRYISEYRSLGETLHYPVFREPWLGQEYGLPRPVKCSDRVSWPVEHYERIITGPGEAAEGDEVVDEFDEGPEQQDESNLESAEEYP